MTTPARPTLLLVALATSALLLTGCSEETPEPKFAETPTAEPTPVEQKETAEEFIRQWAIAEREMQNSGDTAEYREMTKDCAPCQELADDMEEVYGNGGWVRTKGMTIVGVEPVSEDTFRARARIDPTTYVMAEGQAEGRFDGGQRVYMITLKKGADGWQLATLLKEEGQ